MSYKVSTSSNINTATPITFSSNSVSRGGTKKAGYLTESEFVELFSKTFISQYGNNEYPYHPQDLYINALSVLEVMCNTLQGLVDFEFNRPLTDVKNI